MQDAKGKIRKDDGERKNKGRREEYVYVRMHSPSTASFTATSSIAQRNAALAQLN